MNEYQTARKALQDAGFSCTAINRLLAEQFNLHDKFTMAAIQGLLAGGTSNPHAGIVTEARRLADEAMRQRAPK
jgi:hypothetical protein